MKQSDILLRCSTTAPNHPIQPYTAIFQVEYLYKWAYTRIIEQHKTPRPHGAPNMGATLFDP